MTRYVVTGSAGFLGSNLCERLLAEGNEVVGVDCHSSGSESNTERLLTRHQNFSFVRHDIAEPFDVRCDAIFNFACPASPPFYQKDPVSTLKTSVLGTLNVLALAEKHKARVVHASTSEIYGDPLVEPQPETYPGNVNPTGPRACYDEGKRAAETLCADYLRLGRADARVVRIFNTYGPGMRLDDGRVVTNFIGQAMAGKPITIYGDGSQTRSFCYVDDLIEGVLRLYAVRSNPGPVNVGNPSEFTMLQLAEAVQSIVGSSCPLSFEALPVDDPKRRRPDISKARRVLGGWAPKIELYEGLSRTLSYFRK